jgi:hypothetical protein
VFESERLSPGNAPGGATGGADGLNVGIYVSTHLRSIIDKRNSHVKHKSHFKFK